MSIWTVAYAVNPFGWMVRGRYVMPWRKCSRCQRRFSTHRRLYSDFCSHECVTGPLVPIAVFYRKDELPVVEFNAIDIDSPFPEGW